MIARIVLYTRAGCHLCDDAKEILLEVERETGVAFNEVDIDRDPALTAEYGDRIPVVVLDGREHGYWRVEKQRLLHDLGFGAASSGLRSEATREDGA